MLRKNPNLKFHATINGKPKILIVAYPHPFIKDAKTIKNSWLTTVFPQNGHNWGYPGPPPILDPFQIQTSTVDRTLGAP